MRDYLALNITNSSWEWVSGLTSSDIVLMLILGLLLGLLRLLRTYWKKSGMSDGPDIGTMVDQALASNIDSLLNRYSLIWENHGRDLLRVLEHWKEEVLFVNHSHEELVRRPKDAVDVEDVEDQFHPPR